MQQTGRPPAARGSRAKVIPHSHIDAPAYPHPTTGRTWPPRGWSDAGLRRHEIAHARVVAFLMTWGAADATRADEGRMSVVAARARELAQFGRDRTTVAAILDDATNALLDVRAFARADTHPIPRPDLSADTRRTGNRAGTHI